MKTRTNIKAGREWADYVNETGLKLRNSTEKLASLPNCLKKPGNKVCQGLEGIRSVVTNPKFWTWPW
jgi:hypothetical protein